MEILLSLQSVLANGKEGQISMGRHKVISTSALKSMFQMAVKYEKAVFYCAMIASTAQVYKPEFRSDSNANYSLSFILFTISAMIQPAYSRTDAIPAITDARGRSSSDANAMGFDSSESSFSLSDQRPASGSQSLVSLYQQISKLNYLKIAVAILEKHVLREFPTQLKELNDQFKFSDFGGISISLNYGKGGSSSSVEKAAGDSSASSAPRRNSLFGSIANKLTGKSNSNASGLSADANESSATSSSALSGSSSLSVYLTVDCPNIVAECLRLILYTLTALKENTSPEASSLLKQIISSLRQNSSILLLLKYIISTTSSEANSNPFDAQNKDFIPKLAKALDTFLSA